MPGPTSFDSGTNVADFGRLLSNISRNRSELDRFRGKLADVGQRGVSKLGNFGPISVEVELFRPHLGQPRSGSGQCWAMSTANGRLRPNTVCNPRICIANNASPHAQRPTSPSSTKQNFVAVHRQTGSSHETTESGDNPNPEGLNKGSC